MYQVCFSLGSNFGDRKKNVLAGMDFLKSILTRFIISDIYETPEIHGKGKPYLNAVFQGETDKEYDVLNELLKSYEKGCGRDALARERGEVIIDIDIVKWDGKILRSEDFKREFFQIGYRKIAF